MAPLTKEWKFEDIDRHVRSVKLPPPSRTRAATVDPVKGLAQICPIYHGVRPILLGLTMFPFIPEAWKKILAAFVAGMDALCPVK